MADTFFAHMTDAEVRQEMRKHFDKDGKRLYEVDNEEAFSRSVARDAEINSLTMQLWRENCEGLRRIGVDASAYEKAGPVLFGMHEWEHPPRTRMVPRSAAAILHHDAQQPSPGRRRLCGEILEIR